MDRPVWRSPAVAVSVLLLLSMGTLAVLPVLPAAAEDMPPSIAVTIDEGYRSQTVDVSVGSVIARVSGTVTVEKDSVKTEVIRLSVTGTPWEWNVNPVEKTVTGRDPPAFDVSATTTVPSDASEEVHAGKLVATWTSSTGDQTVAAEDEFSVRVVNVPFTIWADANYVLMDPGDERRVTITIQDRSRTGFSYLTRAGDVTSPQPPDWILWTQRWLDTDRLDITAGGTGTFDLWVVVPMNATDAEITIPVEVEVDGHPEYVRKDEITVRVQGPPMRPPAPPGGGDGQWWLDPMFMLGIGLMVMAVGMVAFFGFTEVGLLMLLWGLIVPLFTRIKRSEVLNQFTRGEIYGFIRANPGVHLTSIKENLGLANGVLAYHLKVLLREDYIVARREGGYKRFYPTDMRVPRKRVHFSRLQLDIVEKLSMHPGLTQVALARLLGESKQVINYNVGVLVSAGVLTIEREGSRTLLFAKDATTLRPQVAELVSEDDGEEEPATSGTHAPLNMQ